MPYPSYSNSKNKLKKTYEQTHKNQNEIANALKLINTKYLSINDIKTGRANQLFNHLLHEYGVTYSVIISDIPDEMISYFYLDLSYSLSPNETKPLAYDITKEKNFARAFAEGTLKNEDISLTKLEITSWWIKQTDGWQLYFRPGIIVSIASGVSEFGYSGDSIPVYITANLYYLNDKNYGNIQSGK